MPNHLLRPPLGESQYAPTAAPDWSGRFGGKGSADYAAGGGLFAAGGVGLFFEGLASAVVGWRGWARCGSCAGRVAAAASGTIEAELAPSTDTGCLTLYGELR
jgi:hypothetical protein